ncbi:MAG TPA: hypothetical protein VIY51_02310 [Xanthobacteraceae bacterium]
MRKASTVALAFAGVAVLAGSLAALGMRVQAPEAAPAEHFQPVFTEAKWPFLLDQWGLGRAFVCAPADCGAKVEVYVRPKIGFCNCATGVSDDAELERVADTDLISPQAKPLGPGRPVKIGWMDGRVRSYGADAKAGRGLVSIAFNDECDVVVGLAATSGADPALVAPALVAFLDSRPMVLWAKKELGLEFVQREW